MSDLRQRLASLSAAQRRQLAERLRAKPSPARLRAFAVLRDGAGPTTTRELTQHLEAQLPAHAVPASVTILDELPRLPNGKIDRRKLAAHEPPAPATPAPSAPATDTEATLIAIWQEVLAFDPISVHDDFFEIGGDSILSIQIVSRARAAGLQLSPGDLADHPTISKLAAVAASAAQPTAGPPREEQTGPIPLTPIQQWFFALNLAHPTHWNQAIAVEIDPTLGPDAIRDAVHAVANRHEQLRTGFRQVGDRWIQEIHPDLPGLETRALPEGDQAFGEAITGLQQSFRFDGSPLSRFALLGQDSAQRLVIVTHHLVIDNVSWQILLEDLAVALAAVAQDKPVALAESPASFAQRSHLLAAPESQPAPSERDYWSAPTNLEMGRLPRDHAATDPLLESHSQTCHVELARDASSKLFHESTSAYNTRAEDLLVAALGRTLARLAGRRAFRIGLERHGRDIPGDSLDVNGTIGWFTTFFPLRLDLTDLEERGASIKAIKEQLRDVPRGGIGYGQLRYGDDSGFAAAVSADEDAEDILFNYLGSIPDRSRQDGPIVSFAPLHHAGRAPGNRRSHLLEINCSRQGDLLHMDWIFNTRAHHESTIADWARSYLAELQELIDHCASGQAAGYTPSDFPESEMNQEELDEFLEQL